LKLSFIVKDAVEQAVKAVKQEAPKEYLYLDDAAKYIDVSPDTLYQYTHGKLIKFQKNGRFLVFDKAVLDDWNKNRVKRTRKDKKKLTPSQNNPTAHP
jgi:hypothetical protein